MTETKTDLKPCPFCGSKCSMVSFSVDEYRGSPNENTLIMRCKGCGIEFHIERCFGFSIDASKKILFAMWNRRAGEEREATDDE